jgi:GTP:adenosylcobinamide-phosphate guanylyltransferase
MTHHIYDILSKEIPIKITPDLLNQLRKMVLLFEIRGEHPLTLNSQIIGVNKFIFTSTDRKLFFDIIGYDEVFVNSVIKKIPSINIDFKVTSDALNLITIYLAYLIINDRNNQKLREAAVVDILNYMQYRLISSVVNHYYPHGASDDIMQSVVESLNLKFSIRQYESWKNVIIERSKSLAFDNKAHHNTILKFNVDKDILYLISDTSTRIRSQIKVITSAYYEMKKTNTFITSHSSTSSIDGEKIIRETSGGFSSISSFVFDKIIMKQSFIDEKFIKMVQSNVPRLNESIIRRMLSALSDEARFQMERGETTKVDTKKDLYIGIEVFMEHLIHIIYSTAIQSKTVNINSKISVYTHVKNLFTAARTNNKELIDVRNSFNHLCNRLKISSRESTVSGLGIALALYITLTSFSGI